MMAPGSAAHHARGRAAQHPGHESEHTMDSLPIANDEITRFFHQWLETFASYVRDVDYAAARPLLQVDH
jgi:hypothetical protein